MKGKLPKTWLRDQIDRQDGAVSKEGKDFLAFLGSILENVLGFTFDLLEVASIVFQ